MKEKKDRKTNYFTGKKRRINFSAGKIEKLNFPTKKLRNLGTSSIFEEKKRISIVAKNRLNSSGMFVSVGPSTPLGVLMLCTWLSFQTPKRMSFRKTMCSDFKIFNVNHSSVAWYEACNVCQQHQQQRKSSYSFFLLKCIYNLYIFCMRLYCASVKFAIGVSAKSKNWSLQKGAHTFCCRGCWFEAQEVWFIGMAQKVISTISLLLLLRCVHNQQKKAIFRSENFMQYAT